MTKLTPEEIEIKVEEISRRCKYEGYLLSQAWYEKRKLKLFNSDYTCEKCGYCSYKSIEERPLDVHHKTYERLGNELPGDLMVLCRKCHGENHQK